MKKLILACLMIISTSAMAENYSCFVGEFRLEFKSNEMMSELVVRDRVTGEYVYAGFVDSIQKSQNQSMYHFARFIMTFKTEDLANKEEKIFGFADGTFGRGFHHTTLRCHKKI